MKSKKLISLLCAAALTASSFASLTAFAAAGDTVSTSTFEDAVGTEGTYAQPAMVTEGETEKQGTVDVSYYSAWTGNNWGTGEVKQNNEIVASGFYGSDEDARAYLAKVLGTQNDGVSTTLTNVYRPTTVDAPSVTGNKSLYFATKQGMNKTMTFTIAPTVAASSTQNYGVNFDMMLTDAAYGAEHAGLRRYRVSLSDILKLEVLDGDLFYYDGTTTIDTGIDLPVAGQWFNFDLKVDMENKQFKGTIKAYDGDNLATTATAEIAQSAFATSTVTSITTLSAESVRYDGANKGAVNCAIDNFVVKEIAPTGYDSVTVNYKSGATTLKTTTVLAETGTTFTASDAYKVPFATDDSRTAKKYYVYDTTSTDSVAVAEGAVINLNFTETDMPKTSVVGVIQGTETQIGEIASDYVVPGEKVTGFAHEYMKGTDEKWYQKVAVAYDAKNPKRYDVSATGAADAVTVKVDYVPAYDVVYFAEAEDFENTSTSESGVYYNSGNYPLAAASGGQRATIPLGSATYPDGYMTDVLPAGDYEITVSIFDADGRRGIPVGTLLDSDIAHVTKIGEVSGEGVSTKSFTASLTGTNAKFYIGKCNAQTVEGSSNRLNAPLDYIVVKNTSLDAAPVPEVTIGDIAGGNAALTLTNKEEFSVLGINPKVTLIQAVYTLNALKDVKIWSDITIDSATGSVSAPITGALAETSVFYVWDTVGGVRPLGAAKNVEGTN